MAATCTEARLAPGHAYRPTDPTLRNLLPTVCCSNSAFAPIDRYCDVQNFQPQTGIEIAFRRIRGCLITSCTMEALVLQSTLILFLRGLM
ncbi:hypothetical protein KIN20_021496 [Parelaphostrongylus tenuis]|uniref:Uncharacterized protein n=1 Tax=Parelaphostrongylus tenuis TaxID=148309 RepID=A0AAD5QU81_PARTN|nr:hypothetical protein KIN20_021496 [Parelaphostrongylus tenuis]